MIKTIYTLLTALMIIGAVNRAVAQKDKTVPEETKRKIAAIFSVSEKRAEEIYRIIEYKQEEIESMLSNKVLETAEGASRFKALIAESQANAERLLSQDEKAKMKLTIPPDVEERKRQVIARMRKLQKQGKATIKTNP